MKQIDLNIKPMKWIDNKKRKPQLNGEYLIIWKLDDNNYPVTASAVWDRENNGWRDIITGVKYQKSTVLY